MQQPASLESSTHCHKMSGSFHLGHVERYPKWLDLCLRLSFCGNTWCQAGLASSQMPSPTGQLCSYGRLTSISAPSCSTNTSLSTALLMGVLMPLCPFPLWWMMALVLLLFLLVHWLSKWNFRKLWSGLWGAADVVAAYRRMMKWRMRSNRTDVSNPSTARLLVTRMLIFHGLQKLWVACQRRWICGLETNDLSPLFTKTTTRICTQWWLGRSTLLSYPQLICTACTFAATLLRTMFAGCVFRFSVCLCCCSCRCFFLSHF